MLGLGVVWQLPSDCLLQSVDWLHLRHSDDYLETAWEMPDDSKLPRPWSMYRVVAPYRFPLFSANIYGSSLSRLAWKHKKVNATYLLFIWKGIKIANSISWVKVGPWPRQFIYLDSLNWNKWLQQQENNNDNYDDKKQLQDNQNYSVA
jgi:hypothetical protein